MKKFSTIVALVLVVAMLMCGCGAEEKPVEEPAAAPAEAPVQETVEGGKRDLDVRFIAMGTETPYWDAVYQGLLAAAKDHADDWGTINISFEGPQNSNIDEQISMVQNAIAAGVDAIFCTPLNSDALHDCLVEAHNAGIAVIDGDNLLTELDVPAYFGTDAQVMCEKLAKTLADEGMIGDSGNYVTIVPFPDMQQMQDRKNGFEKYFSDKEGWVMEGQFSPADPTVEGGMNTVQNVLTGGNVDLVFGATDFMGVAAMNVINQAGLEDVVVCSLDCNKELLDGLKEGKVSALALQMPYNQGYYGLEAIFTLVNGGTVEKMNDVGSFILTADNLNTPEAVAAIRQYIPDYEG